jgi:hypothetical protein
MLERETSYAIRLERLRRVATHDPGSDEQREPCARGEE